MSNAILRKFWLENETGDAIPLNGEQGIWLLNVTGLGMSTNSSFANYGNGFYKPVEKDKDPQQTNAGDLYFIDSKDPYMAYRRFADWITQSSELILVYAPSSTQYRRKVQFSSITKEELLTQECIKCPVAFYGLTPWYKITELVISVDGVEETDSPYIVDVSRVGVLPASSQELPDQTPEGDQEDELPVPGEESEFDLWLDGSSGEEPEESGHEVFIQPRLTSDNRYRASIDIYTDAQLPAGFSIRSNGVLANPEITLRGLATGYVYGMCGLSNVSFDSNEMLVYSSTYDDSYIIKIGEYESFDLLNNLDRLDAVSIYPRIPVGELCRIELSSDVPFTSRIAVNLYEYYKGV